MRLMGTILLMLAFSFWTTQSIGAPEPKADAESPQEKVVLKWLGTAGWEIEMGKAIILIDPFLTRKDRSMDAEWKTDEEAVLKVIGGPTISNRACGSPAHGSPVGSFLIGIGSPTHGP